MSEILQQIQDAAKCTQSIQRDITVIKSSVGLSTTPLNAANFSGGRAAAVSWAQVATQAKGSPLPPPPVSFDVHTTKTQPTVTAYKDRVVTVKLKDHGIVQRYRTHPAAWTRHQVETSIREFVIEPILHSLDAWEILSAVVGEPRPMTPSRPTNRSRDRQRGISQPLDHFGDLGGETFLVELLFALH
jgi:hypothetical protein